MKMVKINFDYFTNFTRKWQEVIDYRGKEVLYMRTSGDPQPSDIKWPTEIIFDEDCDNVLVIIDHSKNIEYVCGDFNQKASDTHAHLDWSFTDIIEFNPSKPKQMVTEEDLEALMFTYKSHPASIH